MRLSPFAASGHRKPLSFRAPGLGTRNLQFRSTEMHSTFSATKRKKIHHRGTETQRKENENADSFASFPLSSATRGFFPSVSSCLRGGSVFAASHLRLEIFAALTALNLASVCDRAPCYLYLLSFEGGEAR